MDGQRERKSISSTITQSASSLRRGWTMALPKGSPFCRPPAEVIVVSLPKCSLLCGASAKVFASVWCLYPTTRLSLVPLLSLVKRTRSLLQMQIPKPSIRSNGQTMHICSQPHGHYTTSEQEELKETTMSEVAFSCARYRGSGCSHTNDRHSVSRPAGVRRGDCR
jgi:hypothetical protein